EDWVSDRIVLIGLNKQEDAHRTPYSRGTYPSTLLGVEIHGQMISQILSAVLDQRPLLWWYPDWLEWLWIYGWSLVGGLVMWRYQTGLGRSIAASIIFISLPGTCFAILIIGGWVPLVPCALAALITGSGIVTHTKFTGDPKS
ncbi:MAG: CHASE2 domain-containing protein, partial [Cyanobacteria bacterium J06642_11]